MAQRIVLAIIIVLALAAQAKASCVCRCVDGSVHALCSSAVDIAPICPMIPCGIPPAAIAPIKPPRVPPVGTFQCQQQQVQNPVTLQYEWHRVCQ
jgi:hypothetical protein